MSKKYNWRCKVCDATNISSATTCVECNAPRVLRPLEVDSLKAARGGPPMSPEDRKELARLEKVDAFSDSERTLYWALFIPMLVVTVLFKSAIHWLVIAYGFVVIIAVAAIGGLIGIVAGSQSESSSADALQQDNSKN